MKIRTLTQFEDAVDRETSWRRRELTTLLFNVQAARSSKQQVVLRGGLAMLYAHWEGWIKAVSGLYIQYVDQQGLKHSELAAPFLGMALKKKLIEADEASAARVHTEFADFVLTGGLETKAGLNVNAIRTESNLSSKVLLDITLRLGVPFQPYQIFSALIDERLVATRNSIAHGEYLELDDLSYEDLHGKVLQMLNRFTNDVLANAAARKFRLVP